MKKIVFLLLILLTLISVNVYSASTEDLVKIKKWLESKPECSYDSVAILGAFDRTVSTEEDISKFDYEYRFNLHRLGTFFVREGGKEYFSNLIGLDVKQYQVLNSGDSRQFIRWTIQDVDGDGVVDMWMREFKILVKGCNSDDYYFIEPKYPKWLKTEKYYDITIEEVQEVFDHEIKFWIKYMEEHASTQDKK